MVCPESGTEPCPTGPGTKSDMHDNKTPHHISADFVARIPFKPYSLLRLRPPNFGLGKRPVPNSLHFFVGFAYTS